MKNPAEAGMRMNCKFDTDVSIRSGGVYAARRKILEWSLPRGRIFIPLKFSAHEPLGEQENLHPEKSEYSLFSDLITA